MDNTLIYDVEVFKEDYLLVFLNLNKEVVYKTWNDNPLICVELERLCRKHRIAGFNNYFYDDVILSKIMDGVITPKKIHQISKQIIEGKERIFPRWGLNSIDTKQGLLPSLGLKEIECNMGNKIFECPIDFTIDRVLTEDERKLVEEYCIYDCETTVDIYKIQYYKTIKPKELIVDKFSHIKGVSIKKSFGALGGLIFNTGGKVYKTYTNKEWTKHLKEPMKTHYESINGVVPEVTFNDLNMVTKVKDGGMHGENLKYTAKTLNNFTIIDFDGLYPRTTIAMNLLFDKTALYEQLVDERDEHKHKAKTLEYNTEEYLFENSLQEGLKLTNNTIYGISGYKNSPLYNKPRMYTTAVNSQIACFILAQEIHDRGYINIQGNTDGVGFCKPDFTPVDKEDVEDIIKVVYEKTGLKSSPEYYTKVFQLSTNQYVALGEDGKLKCKGTYFKKYDDNIFSNNSCKIVDKMIVNKLMFNKEFSTTIDENYHNLKDFQIITIARDKFESYSGDTKLQKVNRLFPVYTSEKGAMTELYKFKIDDGVEKRIKFANLPDNFIIYNDNINDIKPEDLPFSINYSYYINLAESNYRDILKKGS